MAEQSLVFRVAEESDAPDIIDLLRSSFAVVVEPPTQDHTTYYDTFDARLHATGFALSLSGEGRLTLSSIDGHPLHCEQATTPLGFAWNLPEGPLRDTIAQKLDIRRLLPLVEVDRDVRTLRILDVEEKTVVRIHLETSRSRPPASVRTDHADAAAEPLPTLVRVLPIKGYDRELATVIDALEGTPGLVRGGFDEVLSAIEATGGCLIENPSKIRLELDPVARAGDAMRAIHRGLLDVVRLNEDGTRTALDTEFLHDYRVTVRRIRSALSQVNGVFPADDLDRFSKEFKWLAAATGPARDADVFLLKLPDYRATLPEKTRRDLDPLKTFLKHRQCAAYGALVKVLDSKRYAKLLVNWKAYLAEAAPPSPTAPNADRPLREVASERIWKVARRVLKNGSAIHDDTPAEALHELRIECKKLRYLLDLFASLYDTKEIRRLLRALKKLQDNLGDFNDCEVQQDALQSFATEMAAEGKTPVETFLAMGRLEDRLQIGQETERQRFSRRFARFASADNRRRIRRLFKSPNA